MQKNLYTVFLFISSVFLLSSFWLVGSATEKNQPSCANDVAEMAEMKATSQINALNVVNIASPSLSAVKQSGSTCSSIVYSGYQPPMYKKYLPISWTLGKWNTTLVVEDW